MGNDICPIKFEKHGIVNNCNKKVSKKSITLRSKVFSVNTIPSISKSSLRKKDKISKDILNLGKNCYLGNLKGKICKDPIDIIVFKYEKCPACEAHIPTLKKRFYRISRYGIPIKYSILDVKKNDVSELYKKSGCSGTPCVVMKSPYRKKYIHISEGIDQDIGFYSSLFGIKNPLYVPLSKRTVPKNLLQNKR